MRSPQTLGQADRRALAAWAADCSEHVLPVFEAAVPGDERPRDLIARARAFAEGDLAAAEAIRLRFAGGVSAREVSDPAALAAARAAGQAAAIAHMGAHALGAAGYAALAAGLAAGLATGPVIGSAASGFERAVDDEICWQLEHLSTDMRVALRLLPALGENRAGPLGPGMLATGEVAAVIRDLQARIAGEPDGAGESDAARADREARSQAPGDKTCS